MTRAGASALVAVVLLAGCGGGGDDGPTPPPQGRQGQSREERVVRGWIAALDRRDYVGAADYFARGAIVQQTAAVRLRTRSDAIAFNRSLPCKAEVTEVRDEGRTVLATFKLRDGPGGACEAPGGRVASARVRCRIRDGRFLEWRQLPEGQDSPDGGVVRYQPPAHASEEALVYGGPTRPRT